MLFNSVIFLLFFLFVYLLYWQLSGRARLYFLILASVFFYTWWGLEAEGWWGLRWVIHFITIVALNYWIVNRMRAAADTQMRKRWLYVALALNIANLGLFKYYGFIRTVFLDLGMPAPPPVALFSFLPLAISFYTFQLLAYTIDVYRGVITSEHSFRNYFLFILFFPQLIAGPIMRSSDFMEQIERPQFTRDRLYSGLWLIMGGLVKKVLIADPLGFILAPVYRSPEAYTGQAIFLAGVAFSIQVYCDFSGYTDIARGVARLLGYDIPENFRAPYFARSARELWGLRWHITLNTWLRDYLYIPLGGSRVARWRAYFNLSVVFAIGGLWHGADYSFVIWGITWGLLLSLERYVEDDLGINTTPRSNPVLIGLKVAFMFVLFVLGALMFRAQAVHTAELDYSSGRIMLQMLSGLFANGHTALLSGLQNANPADAILMAADVFGRDALYLADFPNVQTLAIMILVTVIFHVIQYKPDLFAGLRKYDVPLLLTVGTLLMGVLLPGMAVAAHQFIYFVF
ncbi:MAG: MBOAT family protein [Leptospiraceae bacterium]|nr:MBOAT family protein [Leptospiraceae bacterium]